MLILSPTINFQFCCFNKHTHSNRTSSVGAQSTLDDSGILLNDSTGCELPISSIYFLFCYKLLASFIYSLPPFNMFSLDIMCCMQRNTSIPFPCQIFHMGKFSLICYRLFSFLSFFLQKKTHGCTILWTIYLFFNFFLSAILYFHWPGPVSCSSAACIL